jgi:hypothetical protein
MIGEEHATGIIKSIPKWTKTLILKKSVSPMAVEY